jgi:integrase
MSRRQKDPSYRLHKQSKQAIVSIPDGVGGRRDYLLGPHGSPESWEKYNRIIGEWKANGKRARKTSAPVPDISVNELVLAYWQVVQQYYRHPDGRPTSEINNIKLALRPLKELYGLSAAKDFDSLALEAVRQQMIDAGLCRNRINKDISRIRRMFKWAASKRMVPLEVHQLLSTVEGLRAGRSAARETPKVRAVPLAWVEATLPYLRPQVRAMVELQLAAGMRPGEVMIMRTIDLDTSGDVWLYKPGSDQGEHGTHKTAWRGHDRVICLGPKAQKILEPYLRLNLAEYLFQPREAVAAFHAERRANRKSKIPPSQMARCPKLNPKKKPRDRYTPSTYAQAIGDAIAAANKARACDDCKPKQPEDRCEACKRNAIPHWAPNQLRHTKATEIRKKFGIDAARVVLGHRSPAITETYAELDTSKAQEIMSKLG